MNGKLPFTRHFNSVAGDFQSIWKRLGLIKGHLFGEKRYEEILQFELLGRRIPVQLVFEYSLGGVGYNTRIGSSLPNFVPPVLSYPSSSSYLLKLSSTLALSQFSKYLLDFLTTCFPFSFPQSLEMRYNLLPLILLALPLLMSAAVKSRQKRSFAFGNDESPKPCRIQSEGDQLRCIVPQGYQVRSGD